MSLNPSIYILMLKIISRIPWGQNSQNRKAPILPSTHARIYTCILAFAWYMHTSLQIFANLYIYTSIHPQIPTYIHPYILPSIHTYILTYQTCMHKYIPKNMCTPIRAVCWDQDLVPLKIGHSFCSGRPENLKDVAPPSSINWVLGIVVLGKSNQGF